MRERQGRQRPAPSEYRASDLSGEVLRPAWDCRLSRSKPSSVSITSPPRNYPHFYRKGARYNLIVGSALGEKGARSKPSLRSSIITAQRR